MTSTDADKNIRRPKTFGEAINLFNQSIQLSSENFDWKSLGIKNIQRLSRQQVRCGISVAALTKDSYMVKRYVPGMTRSAARKGKRNRLDRSFNMQHYNTGKCGQVMKISYLPSRIRCDTSPRLCHSKLLCLEQNQKHEYRMFYSMQVICIGEGSVGWSTTAGARPQ